MKYFNLLKKTLNPGFKVIDVKFYSDEKLNLKRVLILNKRTRYELEKALRPGINENHLEKIIRRRGSDFDRIFFYHNRHKEFLNTIVKSFKDFNLEVETVNRKHYGEKEVNWADIVIVGGGDGTFLLGASQIHDKNKPIVGFNTNPDRSVGHLCLPRNYTHNIETAVKKIMKNEFKWVLRNRIEVELEGAQASDNAVVIDSAQVQSMPDCAGTTKRDSEVTKRILPSLALNEVFMGETMSSHVSHLVVDPDDSPATAVKCSGLCVCTGTGSTSWNLSINSLTEDKIKKLLILTGHSLDKVADITEKYNSSWKFSPDDGRLLWSLREPIYSSVFPDPPGLPAGGFTKTITVSSRCFSGFLVVDGTHCYPFHDGTRARLFSRPEKRLRTVYLI